MEKANRKDLWNAMVHMRRLMVVVVLFELFTTSTFIVGSSHMRTIVECAEPLPDEQGSCPSGSFFNAGRCEAAPRGSKDWSFSSHCADKAYVVGTATVYQGTMAVANRAATIVGVTVLGPQLDIWGRKPLLVLTFAAYLLGVVFILISTYMVETSSKLHLIFAGVTIPNLFDVLVPAARAMVADLSKNDTLDRSSGFAAVQLVGCLGKLIALMICTGILSLNLAEYRPVWFAFCLAVALMTAVIAIVLRETLPKEPDAAKPTEDGMSPVEGAESATAAPAVSRGGLLCEGMRRNLQLAALAVQNMFWQVAQAALLAWQEPLIGHVSFIVGVLGGIQAGIIPTMTSYLLEALGYTQAMTQIPGAMYPLVALVAAAVCARFVKCYGPAIGAEAGMFLLALGFSLLGLSALYAKAAHVLFWVGYILLCFGSSFPPICLITIMSIRVSAYSQGKLDALLQVVMLLLSMLGSYLWTHYFYARWRSGWIFWPGTVVSVTTMLWFAVAYRRWHVPSVEACGA